MIWRGGSRTKKQKEVTAEMWALLVVEEVRTAICSRDAARS